MLSKKSAAPSISIIYWGDYNWSYLNCPQLIKQATQFLEADGFGKHRRGLQPFLPWIGTGLPGHQNERNGRAKVVSKIGQQRPAITTRHPNIRENQLYCRVPDESVDRTLPVAGSFDVATRRAKKVTDLCDNFRLIVYYKNAVNHDDLLS